jgi:hypothetical protein
LAYVRRKGAFPNDYHQLVESRRIDGKPRQKVLLHLGRHPTTEAALKAWAREIRKLRRDAEKERDSVPEDYESVYGMKTFYRRSLMIADSFERQADELEEKLERLREFERSDVVPSTAPLL